MIKPNGYDDSHLDDWEKLGLSREDYWKLKNSNLPRFQREILYLSLLLGGESEEDEIDLDQD